MGYPAQIRNLAACWQLKVTVCRRRMSTCRPCSLLLTASPLYTYVKYFQYPTRTDVDKILTSCYQNTLFTSEQNVFLLPKSDHRTWIRSWTETSILTSFQWLRDRKIRDLVLNLVKEEKCRYEKELCWKSWEHFSARMPSRPVELTQTENQGKTF